MKRPGMKTVSLSSLSRFLDGQNDAVQNFFVYLAGIDVCPDIPDRQAHGARHEQQAQNRDTDADRPAVYALVVQSFRFFTI